MEKSQLPVSSVQQSQPPKSRLRAALTAAAYAWILLCMWRTLGLGLSGLHPAPGSQIQWTACGSGLECGRLEVTLDYFNASKGVASLSLARFPAANAASRLGSVFMNPGGPGGSGVGSLHLRGRQLAALLDGRYDIVSWDPRGVNGTTPRLACFKSETEQTLFAHHSALAGGLEVGNLSDPVDRAAFAKDMRALDARWATASALCERHPEASLALAHMDTATAVRDLVRLADAVEGEGAPINYWGFSYGTLLGAYFVNMFPDRVGRVIIDGNLDPVAWSQTRFADWSKDSFRDSEKAYRNFVTDCAKAGPERCALATNSSTPESISEDIDNILKQLYRRPLPVPGAKRADVLTSALIRSLLFQSMYKASTWPGLAKVLAEVKRGDGVTALDRLASVVELDETKPAGTEFSTVAVVCSDAPPLPESEKNEDVLEELIESIVHMYENGTPHFGTGIVMGCHNWRKRAPARFAGPFNRTLSNTILIIGNTADPVTPLRNAKNLNVLLKDSSRLVIQDGSGHCSLAAASLCTANTVRAYFTNGTLPENGRVCSISEPTFPDPSNETTVSTWLVDEDRTPENVRVLEIMRDIVKSWPKHGYSWGL